MKTLKNNPFENLISQVNSDELKEKPEMEDNFQDTFDVMSR